MSRLRVSDPNWESHQLTVYCLYGSVGDVLVTLYNFVYIYIYLVNNIVIFWVGFLFAGVGSAWSYAFFFRLFYSHVILALRSNELQGESRLQIFSL